MSVRDIIFAAGGNTSASEYIIPNVVSYTVFEDKIYYGDSTGLVSYVDIDNLTLTPTPILSHGGSVNRLAVANNKVFITGNSGNIYMLSDSKDEFVISSISDRIYSFVKYDQITKRYVVRTYNRLYLSDDGITWRDSNITLPETTVTGVQHVVDNTTVFYNGVYAYPNTTAGVNIVDTNTGTIRPFSVVGNQAYLSFSVFNSRVYISDNVYNSHLWSTPDFKSLREIIPSSNNDISNSVIFNSMCSVANNKLFFYAGFFDGKMTTAYITDNNVVFHSRPITVNHETVQVYYSHTFQKYYLLYINIGKLHIRESIDGLTWT